MYGFSRAIYRELESEIVEGPKSARNYANHERVLRACEAAVERLNGFVTGERPVPRASTRTMA